MRSMVQLTQKPGSISDGGPGSRPKPVWVNAFGVNSVQACGDGGTWVRMDDGTGYLVTEEPEYVVAAIEERHTEEMEVRA